MAMAHSSNAGPSAPPAYTETVPDTSAQDELAARLTSLTMNLTETAAPIPATSALVAHLRLLHAFDTLKASIGYRNGLWSIYDSRARKPGADGRVSEDSSVLAKLREKRWAVYLGRAVDRYVAWWESFVPERLLESDMLKPERGGAEPSEKYGKFMQGDGIVWTAEILPPLGELLAKKRIPAKTSLISVDVLLVFHTHLLNPRFFLEVSTNVRSSPWSWAKKPGLPEIWLPVTLGSRPPLVGNQRCN